MLRIKGPIYINILYIPKASRLREHVHALCFSRISRNATFAVVVILKSLWKQRDVQGSTA